MTSLSLPINAFQNKSEGILSSLCTLWIYNLIKLSCRLFLVWPLYLYNTISHCDVTCKSVDLIVYSSTFINQQKCSIVWSLKITRSVATHSALIICSTSIKHNKVCFTCYNCIVIASCSVQTKVQINTRRKFTIRKNNDIFGLGMSCAAAATQKYGNRRIATPTTTLVTLFITSRSHHNIASTAPYIAH